MHRCRHARLRCIRPRYPAPVSGTAVAAGPVVAGGMVFLPSGYSELGNGVRGNVLLAFGVK